MSPYTFMTMIVLWIVAAAWTPAIAQEPIPIGVISSLSGPMALLGTGGHQGAIMATEEINQKGGVLGRPLKLLMRDDKSSTEEGAKAFRELAAEGVAVVVGNVISSVAASINPHARELKVPFFSVIGFARFLTEEAGHRYFFRLVTNDRVYGYPVAEFMAKQAPNKYCTIANDFAFGREITRQVMTRLKELKPAAHVLPGCEFWAPIGTADFTPQITVILAKRPDALMFGGVVGTSAPAFIKQAKSFGLFTNIQGVHTALGYPVNTAGLARADVPEGIFTGGDYPYPPLNTPLNKTFFEAYRKRWNQLPLSEPVNSYTTVRFVAQALQKAGRVDREAFVEAAERMSIEHPSLGVITVRPFDHQANAGWWMGYLTWDESNNRAGMRDTWYVKPEAYLPSQEEIQRLRSQKK